ncbi:hypothetical protein GR160_17755 [Flavobacterium sp. Sd200]|uniref:hypothetical protein n=1 Tax=Flavobacterium sp. Sd200 TaxID=2692211 RepID=UPI00136DD44A|nr:hypothetical protein [Flavobacterium sp. Sd200]MXN93075.1 hypothetical protein [Flavobacterium sp. Sd200]
MKNIAAFLFCFLLLSCASSKSSKALVNNNTTVESECPPKGDCIAVVHKNKKLVIKTSDIGQTYYEIEDAPDRVVVTYTYTKTRKSEYQDDFYSEEIAFESDENLSDFRNGASPDMYFKVLCFCRGKMGTYKVDGAKATLNNNKLSLTIPQIVDNQFTQQIVVSFN